MKAYGGFRFNFRSKNPLCVVVGNDEKKHTIIPLTEFGRTLRNCEMTTIRAKNGERNIHVAIHPNSFAHIISFFGKYRSSPNDRLNLTVSNLPQVLDTAEELGNPERCDDNEFVEKAMKRLKYQGHTPK